MRKLLLVISFVLLPAILCAQNKESEKRKFGLTFPNIGVIWHINDNVAFLPGLSFGHNWSSGKGVSSASMDSSGNSLNVESSFRFYVQEWKGIRFYISPKYGYGWRKSDAKLQDYNSNNHDHSVAGAWGLQYTLGNRVGIWGDIGVEYAHGNFTSKTNGAISMETMSNAVSTVGSWGLILYLK